MKKQKNNEKTLIEIFNEKYKNGSKVYNLFNFYQYQYDIEKIVNLLDLYKIPFNMEFVRDQDTNFSISGYTGGARYPDYVKNFVRVFILEEDYQKSENLIQEIIEKYTDKESNILDGIVIFKNDKFDFNKR